MQPGSVQVETYHNLWQPMADSQGIVLRNLLHRTTHVSRPLVATVRIQAGPQAHERDSHFAAYEGPGLDRLGIVAPTFWAGHLPLLSREPGVSYHRMKRMGLVRSLVRRRWADHT